MATNPTPSTLSLARNGEPSRYWPWPRSGLWTSQLWLGEIACAIKPLVADRIFVSEFVGNLTVFSLPKEPWANELRELAAAICKRDNRLAGELRALRTMMISGVYRAPMKRRLERYESLGI